MNLKILLLLTRYIDQDRWSKFQPLLNQSTEKRKIEYLHPDLKPILERTYGVIVYQEQIMQIASKLAGFSLGEADLLRRAVSKKIVIF